MPIVMFEPSPDKDSIPIPVAEPPRIVLAPVTVIGEALGWFVIVT